jgi:serine/threonine protein kinase
MRGCVGQGNYGTCHLVGMVTSTTLGVINRCLRPYALLGLALPGGQIGYHTGCHEMVFECRRHGEECHTPCHLVFHLKERRQYVVKRIPVFAMEERGEALREAKLLSKLKHPNVIAYKESFLCDADKTLCIVTAYAEEVGLSQGWNIPAVFTRCVDRTP